MMGYIRRNTRELAFSLSFTPPPNPLPMQKEVMIMAIYKPGRELSSEPEHAGSLIMNF